MLSPTVTDDSCDEIDRVIAIQDSYLLHFSEILMLSLSMIAIPISIWALFKCCTCKIFHINIRLIGALHCISLMIHCVGRVIQHSSAIYLWLADVPICEKRQFLKVCILSRGMYIFGVYSSSFTSVFMCIERTIATKFCKKYEHKRWNMGLFLVSLQVVLSLFITINFFEMSNFEDRPVYCIFEMNKKWTLVNEFLTICANFVALWQCWRLHRINTNIRIHEHAVDLSQKFQVEENKTLIRILIRFTILDFLFMMTYFLLGFVIEYFEREISEPMFLAGFELIHCVPLYTIVVLILTSIIIKRVHDRKMKKIDKSVHIKEDAYFNYLQKQWT